MYKSDLTFYFIFISNQIMQNAVYSKARQWYFNFSKSHFIAVILNWSDKTPPPPPNHKEIFNTLYIRILLFVNIYTSILSSLASSYKTPFVLRVLTEPTFRRISQYLEEKKYGDMLLKNLERSGRRNMYDYCWQVPLTYPTPQVAPTRPLESGNIWCTKRFLAQLIKNFVFNMRNIP